MQIFIIGGIFETATALDYRRFNKQVIETDQIIGAINGSKAWFNHPCVKQYRKHLDWLELYRRGFIAYREHKEDELIEIDNQAYLLKPEFHIPEYYNQMKRRLYTKDSQFYSTWSYLGKSDINWYWSDEENKFIYYQNGKRIYYEN